MVMHTPKIPKCLQVLWAGGSVLGPFLEEHSGDCASS